MKDSSFAEWRDNVSDLNFAFYSDVGGRSNNEDSYIAKKIDNNYLFIVADGLGGHDGGELASRAVVDSIEEYILKHKEFNIATAVEFANRVVINMQTATNSKMKSTVVIAYVTPRKTYFAHVGDTRVYAFKGNSIISQSIDHSVPQLAVSTGEITPDGIRSHTNRNVLTRALGASKNVKVDVTELDNSEYDSLLLCSDGFWEYVLENDMISTKRASHSAEKWLCKMRAIQLENSPSNCDNNTAIAVIKEF